MNRTKVVFSLLLPLLLALCLYRLASTPARVSALSTGPPASTAGALASQAVCLRGPLFAEGPPAGYSGAPREATCHWCHRTYPVNDPSGGVRINGLPDSYVPGGDRIDFTVTVFQDGTNGANIDWGFELTVLDANNIFAGELVTTDIRCGPSSDRDCTRKIDDEMRVDGSTRYYIEQTEDGIFFNTAGAPSATWNMGWVPPATDVGPVTFYVAGNAGTGQRIPSGTYVFLSNQPVLGPGANFVAHAHWLSDPRQGPKAVLALRPASPHSHRGWIASAPPRNGMAPVVAP